MRFNYDTVFRRLQELAYLNRGLKIVFLDERVSDPARRETTFHYEGGIIDYVRYLNDGKTVLHDQPIYLEGQKDSVICRVAIQYTDGYTESLFPMSTTSPRVKAERTKQASRRHSRRCSTTMPAATAS